MLSRQCWGMMPRDDSSTLATAQDSAREIARRPDVSALELAEALWRAEQLGPGSLLKVVEETGLGRRKAYYLISIWSRFASLGIAKSELAEVGWTKLAIIARHAGPNQEKGAIALGKSVTARDLPRLLMGGRTDRPPRHSVLLSLSPTQYRIFSNILRRFGATAPRKGKGLVSKERALIKALASIAPDRQWP